MFNVDAFGHPFYIKTLQGLGTDDLVTGAENNGTESGTVIWTTTKKEYFITNVHYITECMVKSL